MTFDGARLKRILNIWTHNFINSSQTISIIFTFIISDIKQEVLFTRPFKFKFNLQGYKYRRQWMDSYSQ